MTEKTVRTLGISAGLLAVALGASWAFGDGVADARASGIEAPFSWVELPSVDSATLRTSSGTRVLRRDGDRWTMDGARVEANLVNRFWRDALESRMIKRASRNPSNHARMGVGERDAPRLTIHTPLVNHELLVGNSGTRSGTSFVRRPQDDEVWLLDADLSAHMARSFDVWRDRQVISIDTSDIEQIWIEWPGKTEGLVRGEDGWRLAKADRAADETTVQGILSELSALRADGFVALDDPLMTAPSRLRMEILNADEERIAILTLGGTEGDRWLRSRDDDSWYRISERKAGRLVPDLDALPATDGS